MIKFFRKLRQQLLTENKFSKYLIYAIGEIVLVVIGILIALSINNWNEQNKIAVAEQQILKDIRIEVLSNIENLEQVTASNQKSLENARILQQFYKNPSKLKDFPSDSITQLTYTLNGELFFPENGMLNSLISTGQLSYIKNKKLSQALASLKDKSAEKMQATNSLQADGAIYLRDNIYPEVAAYIENYELVPWDIKRVYKLPIFSLAIFGTFDGRRAISLKREAELMEIYKDVLNLINQELKVQN